MTENQDSAIPVTPDEQKLLVKIAKEYAGVSALTSLLQNKDVHLSSDIASGTRNSCSQQLEALQRDVDSHEGRVKIYAQGLLKDLGPGACSASEIPSPGSSPSAPIKGNDGQGR